MPDKRGIHTIFPFTQADVLDKWNVNSMNAEVFKHYIDGSKLTAPGTLSATTTAKLIIYCLLIMEAEHQALQAAGVKALQFSRPDAQDVVNSLAARASDVSDGRCATTANRIIRADLDNAFNRAVKLGALRFDPIHAVEPEKDERRLPRAARALDHFQVSSVVLRGRKTIRF